MLELKLAVFSYAHRRSGASTRFQESTIFTTRRGARLYDVLFKLCMLLSNLEGALSLFKRLEATVIEVAGLL